MVARHEAERRKDVKYSWHITDRLHEHDIPETQRRPTKGQLVEHWKRSEAAKPKVIVRVIPESNTLTKSNLARVQADLLDLKKEENPEIRPTPFAFAQAWVLIALSGRAMQDAFPFGYVMDDGDNGVRFEWEHNSKHVRLIIPAQPRLRHYIYYQEGEMRGTDNVTLDKLIGWLYWLNEE
ncbi:MAG: hypothetical protein M3437_08330 [Chloroflexota bacterium]|nr:hypothetical protein [Chloroflexota bacterium]MDQ5867179.1 hypothetical protein [Chloroflexota bacterium]